MPAPPVAASFTSPPLFSAFYVEFFEKEKILLTEVIKACKKFWALL
jgi:hypothetical protein